MRRVCLRGISQHPWSGTKGVVVMSPWRGEETGRYQNQVSYLGQELWTSCVALAPRRITDSWMQMDCLSFFAVLSSASGSLCDLLLTVQ